LLDNYSTARQDLGGARSTWERQERQENADG
jgi:hypothetical protein